MQRVLEIASYILVPRTWGLAVEFFFAWLRRRRTELTPEEDVE